MIIIKEILLNIAKNILKISPVCSNKSVILLSAIGSTIPDNNLYTRLNIPNFIIGVIQIPTIMITPTKPTAFFKIIPPPKYCIYCIS